MYFEIPCPECGVATLVKFEEDAICVACNQVFYIEKLDENCCKAVKYSGRDVTDRLLKMGDEIIRDLNEKP